MNNRKDPVHLSTSYTFGLDWTSISSELTICPVQSRTRWPIGTGAKTKE
jgi:hypothetical protein